MDRKDVTTSTHGMLSPSARITVLSVLTLAGACRTREYSSTGPVGEVGPRRYVTPVHQVLTPVGVQVELPGVRPQAVALSPDGRLLATAGKTQELVLIDPRTGDMRPRVP